MVGFSALQVVFLLLRSQVLENPVLLDLVVSRVLLLQVNHRVHLLVKRFPRDLISILPEPLAIKFKGFILLIFCSLIFEFS